MFGYVYMTIYLPWVNKSDVPWRYIGSTTRKGAYFGSVSSKKWKEWWNSEIKEFPERFEVIKLASCIIEDINELHNLERDIQLQHNAIFDESFFNKGLATKGIYGVPQKGKKNPCYGRCGELHPLFGKKRPEHSAFMSSDKNPMKRQDLIDVHYMKNGEWRDIQRKRFLENNPMNNPDSIEKLRKAVSGPRPNARKPKIKTPCKYCGLPCAPHILNKWHNENCKQKDKN